MEAVASFDDGKYGGRDGHGRLKGQGCGSQTGGSKPASPQRQEHFFPQTFSVQIAARLSKAFGCALFGT
ncbi:MAG: hypothetical protein ACLUN5_08040 [Oscillospiraceae bacterium]